MSSAGFFNNLHEGSAERLLNSTAYYLSCQRSMSAFESWPKGQRLAKEEQGA
jgi:hypothetical protein